MGRAEDLPSQLSAINFLLSRQTVFLNKKAIPLFPVSNQTHVSKPLWWSTETKILKNMEHTSKIWHVGATSCHKDARGLLALVSFCLLSSSLITHCISLSGRNQITPPKAENFSFPLGFTPARSLLAVTVVLGYQKKVRQPCIGQMKSESSQEAWTGKASLLLMARSQLASVRTLAPLVEAGSYHKSFPLARLDLLVLNSEGGTSIQRKTNHLDSTA